MKILFFSDLHGSYFYLEKLMNNIKDVNPELIVFAGDLLYHGPRNELPEDYNPKKCIKIINNIANFIAVRGNCDAEVDQMVINHPIMNSFSTIYDNGRTFFITHGHIYDELSHPFLPEGSVFVSGHTHIPVCKEENGVMYFNPGSLSIPKNGFDNSFGYYDGNFLSVRNLEGNDIMSLKIR